MCVGGRGSHPLLLFPSEHLFSPWGWGPSLPASPAWGPVKTHPRSFRKASLAAALLRPAVSEEPGPSVSCTQPPLPPPLPELEPQALFSGKKRKAQTLKGWALESVQAFPGGCLLCDSCQVT